MQGVYCNLQAPELQLSRSIRDSREVCSCNDSEVVSLCFERGKARGFPLRPSNFCPEGRRLKWEMGFHGQFVGKDGLTAQSFNMVRCIGCPSSVALGKSLQRLEGLRIGTLILLPAPSLGASALAPCGQSAAAVRNLPVRRRGQVKMRCALQSVQLSRTWVCLETSFTRPTLTASPRNPVYFGLSW